MYWIDGIAIATVLGFSVLGSNRGLVDQVLRIVPSWGTVVLMLLTQSFWLPFLDPWVPVNYRSTAALVVAAIAAYPILMLLARYVLWRLQGTPLGIFNKIGGGLMGLIQGSCLVLLIGFCLWLTPVANEKSFRQSYLAKGTYPLIQKASTQYLWIALKTQPKSWFDRVATTLWA